MGACRLHYIPYLHNKYIQIGTHPNRPNETSAIISLRLSDAYMR